MNNTINNHTEHSAFREKLIEHLFVGELLKLSWIYGDCQIEISKPEVDNSGYDIIAEANGIIRHIQIKSSYIGGKTAKQKIHIKLSEKPSGCVVWIYFDEKTLSFGPYYFLGFENAAPLKSIIDAKVAKHSKGDKDGFKAQRPNIREVNKGAFVKFDTIDSLYNALFCIKDM
jgi:hypothetical protein